MIPIDQFHPIIVHFPIVFLLSLAALDTIALTRRARIDGRGGVANLSAGLAALAGLAAGFAYFFGDMALDAAVSKGFTEARLETHETLGTITAVLLVIWGLARAILWWRNLPLANGRAWAVALVEVALALLIIATAYYGGQLVYDFGVNVTRT